ncbi:hypothetical protein Palpr_2050 [Paludibacter propionicigenes WB4]|uniref:Uncharacterized protein n=1 Tax=Paludibacter propionicigenes (strain DSM 17365 / JCM 13257 / WB4) TaxID=694427 RepID=E4T643_PALPW|nr:hypothetical protein Palpr_2050 [Paludibacter propionicigenes WB4]
MNFIITAGLTQAQPERNGLFTKHSTHSAHSAHRFQCTTYVSGSISPENYSQ